MPIACVVISSYKAALARLANPALRGRPLIVADRLERGHAIEVDAGAFALGARTGMTLVQAGACAREAAIVVDDPARNAELWERVLDALDAASPLVEDAGEGVAFLEMRGITPPERSPNASAKAHTKTLECRWIASIAAALDVLDERAALAPRIGLAPNKFVARAAAIVNDGTIVYAGEERAFVAPLPLEALHVETATIERLRLLGVGNLSALAALPHGPFVRRFGAESARWHACANGADAEPIVPRARRLTIDRTMYGEGTAEREDQLLFALRTLVARVSDDIADAGKRCGFLRLTLECEDGETLDLPTLLAQPTSQSATMFDLLRARLEGLTSNGGAALRSPVTGLRLGAERLEDGGTALSLFAGSDPDPEAVAIALARIEAALGPHAALRAREVSGFRFESRYAYDAFDPSRIARVGAGGFGARAGDSARTGAVATLAYRLVTPRAIEVRVARGAPVSVDARNVLECAGPWRSDEGWWGDALAELDASASAAASTASRAHDAFDGVCITYDAYDTLLDDGSLIRIVACVNESDATSAWYEIGKYD